LQKSKVRQGGVWSPTAYNVFVSSLLKAFEDRKLGAHLGSLYCVIPTVADDVTLVSNDPNELQLMLSVQSSFANKQRIIIGTKKSCVLQNGCDKDKWWTINNETLQTPTSAPHLGLST
jgi:hypothetical protein